MPGQSNDDLVFTKTSRVHIGNPTLWDRLVKPFIRATFLQQEIRVRAEDVVDLKETTIGGRSVFVVMAKPETEETGPRTEDPIAGLVELLMENLRDENWKGINDISSSLLRNFRGQPGGMYHAALNSPLIGILHDALMTAKECCNQVIGAEATFATLQQTVKDLALDGTPI